MKVLTGEEVKIKLQDMDGWKASEDGFLERTFQFHDFNETYGFIARVALLAEAVQHHPDWSGTYRTVTLKLRTHDADGITEKDILFAKKATEFTFSEKN